MSNKKDINKFTLRDETKEDIPVIFDFIVKTRKNNVVSKEIKKIIFKRIDVRSTTDFSSANYAVTFYKPISRIKK